MIIEFDGAGERLYLCNGKQVRPAPAELPQIRKEARVGGRSGAIPRLPFLFYRLLG
jgi:hypothetical protein